MRQRNGYVIREERLAAEEYIDFLKHTDLCSQYPKERFERKLQYQVEHFICLNQSGTSKMRPG